MSLGVAPAFLATDQLLLLILNALSLAVLYILVASGLAVIFGMTDIINFAHGVLYMLGAYFALQVIEVTGSFYVALLVAPIAVGVVGLLIERFTLNKIYDRGPLYHILVTFGFVLIITDLVEWIWGPAYQNYSAPEIISGSMSVGPVVYPRYRIFVIITGSFLALATWMLFRYSKFGLIIRAGAQDRATVRLMGVDIAKYFTLVFALGSILAGAAGVLAGPFLSVEPEMGNAMLIIAFIIVIVGGLGSFAGAVIAAVIIAFLEVLTIMYASSLTGYTVYLAMLAILIFRPEGILGSYEVRQQLAKISFDETIEPLKLSDHRVLLVIGFMAVLPLGMYIGWMSSYMLGLISLMLIWGLFALSLDIVMGYIGLISFGHAAFWGVGAYGVALTITEVTQSFFLAIAVAVVVSTALAWLIGAMSMRVHGVYFAMITLAAAQLLYHFANTQTAITGGANGLAAPALEIFGVIDLGATITFYYLVLVALIGSYFVSYRLMDSPFGRTLAAIRESERRVSFLGYDTNKYKRQAFAISGGIGGLAGALFVMQQNFVSPSALFWVTSGDVIFAMILGGIGTLYGPIVGGVVLVGMEHILSSYIRQWRLVIGIILVLVVLFAPRGLVSVYIEGRKYLQSNPIVQDIVGRVRSLRS